MRLTTIADFDSWQSLSEAEYARQKMLWYDRSVASAVRFIPDFRSHVIDTMSSLPKRSGDLHRTTTDRFTVRPINNLMGQHT